MCNESAIPIVFSADDNYIPMLGTAIYSILENASEKYFYKLYIFYTNVSETHRRKMQALNRHNSEIIFVDVSEHIDKILVENNKYLSSESIYQLFIPDILPQYDKIIYLDSDLVVEGDISQLYQIDIQDSVLGAVQDGLSGNCARDWQENLNLSLRDTFNTGVIIINTKLFKTENIKAKCLELLQEDRKNEKRSFRHRGQDVLNITCDSMVKFMPMEWNIQWRYLIDREFMMLEKYETEYREAEKNLKILHFSGRQKPWDYPEYNGAEYFWKYARRCIFYEELLKKTVKNVDWQLLQYPFPYEKVNANDRIILYGAGKVGTVFQRQLELTRYCSVALWVDNDYKKLQENGKNVVSPQQIIHADYNVVVIAVEQEKIATSIKNELVKSGIPSDKIIWGLGD